MSGTWWTELRFDFFQRLTDNPDIGVALYKPGNRSNVYLNPQIPPFSYLKGRQALMTGIDVEDFMFALGPNDLWITCRALYWCGTPLETDIGARFDIELADGQHCDDRLRRQQHGAGSAAVERV